MISIPRLARRCLSQLALFVSVQLNRASCEETAAKGLLQVGRYTYGNPLIMSYQGSEARVVIGNFCSISPGVVIITGGVHPVDWVSTYPFRLNWGLPGALEDGTPATRGDIVIGSDVWLGTDAMVLSGVTVGHGAVIAARAVVARGVPPYAIAAGVPARVVGHRFDPETVARLLAIQWWEWNDDRIMRAVPLLSSSDFKAFIERYATIS